MLFNYLFLFCIGSILGFFLELIYRRIKENKWIKPGVFNGIYLPLYGMGLCICYFVYNLSISFILKLIMLVMFLTFIEFVCGLIFIKCFKIPLWDYSNNFLNYKGLICFKFSVYWGMIGLMFLLLFSLINNVMFYNVFSCILVILFLVVLLIDVSLVFYKLFKNIVKY